jgi:hypothetical protein
MMAALLLAPLAAMIIGPLVAEKLQLAARGAYTLSVIAALLIAVLGTPDPLRTRAAAPPGPGRFEPPHRLQHRHASKLVTSARHVQLSCLNSTRLPCNPRA